MSGTLYGIGVGPGDPELMTLKAVRLIEESQIIAVPKSSDEAQSTAYQIACAAAPQCRKKPVLMLDMPMTRDRQLWERSHDQAAASIINCLQEGKDVAFLTLGDPSIYSTYTYVHERVLRRGYAAQMVAGVPSFCAVAARLNESLTQAASPLHIIPASYQGVEESLEWPGVKVLMKTGRSLQKVRWLLQEQGVADSVKMVQKCGMPGEQVYESLSQVPQTASYFSILVVPPKEETK